MVVVVCEDQPFERMLWHYEEVSMQGDTYTAAGIVPAHSVVEDTNDQESMPVVVSALSCAAVLRKSLPSIRNSNA